jgi:signal transduction histidine kinase
MTQKVKIPLSTKFALTFAPLFLFAMLMTIYAVHRTVTLQFTERYENELHISVLAVERELKNKQHSIKQQLQQLAEQIREDHEFRLHTSVLDDIHHSYIVNYASRYIATMGLQSLEIIDGNGILLSSGHYRHAFGGDSRSMLRNIRQAEDDIVLAWFDHPDGYILCLTAFVSFRIGNLVYHIIGGTEVHETFLRALQPNARNVVLLRTPVRFFSSDPDRIEPAVLDEIYLNGATPLIPDWLREEYSFSHLSIPVADRNSLNEGGIYLLHSRTELMTLLRTLNEKIAAITVVGIIFVLILAFWQAGNVARPLRRLARKASDISLESLDDNFTIRSKDEVGILNDALKEMVQRLRKSRLDLAVAEQKAAFAEIARKINHDIKNGFIPIRNVMQHWSEVADSEPDELVHVFKERRETVNESLRYLQEMARNYARTTPKTELESVDIREVVDTVIRNYSDLPGKRISITSDNSHGALYVMAEHDQIRRAIENIVCNAVEACDDEGKIKIFLNRVGSSVEITIEDNGNGIPPEIKEKLFHTHVTTKSDGTGIGLMNAHTIIKEFGGSILISDPDSGGTSVRISLPRLLTEFNDQYEQKKEESTV